MTEIKEDHSQRIVIDISLPQAIYLKKHLKKRLEGETLEEGLHRYNLYHMFPSVEDLEKLKEIPEVTPTKET